MIIWFIIGICAYLLIGLVATAWVVAKAGPAPAPVFLCYASVVLFWPMALMVFSGSPEKEEPHQETPNPSTMKSDQEHIEQFFAYQHLPIQLQEVSKPFSELATTILQLPRNPERTVALRKLLEAKDAAVRAKVATICGK